MTSGRPISYAARRNGKRVLAESDLCHLCGHTGARTVDHIITPKEWLAMHGTLDGVDDEHNLAPAHGTKGNHELNPCPLGCGLCNQRRGDRPLPQLTRRPW